MPLVSSELKRLEMMMLVLVGLVDGRMSLFLSRGPSRGRQRMMTLFGCIGWLWWVVQDEHES